MLPAVVKWQAGRALCEYACPRCGTHHELEYSSRATRAYAIAAGEGECACPGRQSLARAPGRRAGQPGVLAAARALGVQHRRPRPHAPRPWSRHGARGEPDHGYFLEAGLVPALIFKVGVVTLGALLLWRLRRHAATLVVTTALASTYALVVLYQAFHELP